MVNLTLPKLPNRPGLGEALSNETVPAPDAPSVQSKGSPKFEDHLAQPEPKAKAAQNQVQAKVAAKPNPQGPTRRPTDTKSDAKASPANPKANANLARADQAILSQKPQAKSDKPATPAEREPLSNTKEVTASGERADDASKASPEKPPTKAKNAKVAGLGEKADKDSVQAGTDNDKPSILVIQPEDLPTSEQGSLDEVALDLSNEEGATWEKRLEDMLAFMGIQPANISRELPSLAILTGQLQFVEPESIPTTLAESPMLGNVMASADPSTIIDEVKPLGDWLNDMGWSGDGLIIKDPVAFQDLMNTPVSLKDLMKTFQVDPDRIVAEAKILQETIPMDGAAPYIARATKMQADPSLPQLAPKKVAGVDPTVSPAVEKMSQEKEARNPMEAEFLNVILGNAGLNPKATNGADSKAPETQPMPKVDGKAQPLSSIDQMLASLAIPSGNPAMEGMPKAMLTTQNPFQSIEMRSSETFTFDPESGIDDTPIVSRSERRDFMENIQAFNIQSDSSAPQAVDKARAFDPSVLLERLSEVTLTGSGDSNGSDAEGDEGLQHSNDESFTNFNSAPAQKSSTIFQLETAEPSKVQAPQQLKKEVFDNASMLVKDGGGAMRIDIGNKELGAIDLAVEVKDNKVEIKIVAASPQAREMLATELPKLRESLQNQNLNLSKVEIGLSGGSSWTSSDGRSSQREQSSQREELLGVSGTGQKSSRSYRQVNNTQNLQPQVIHDGGSIKVRV